MADSIRQDLQRAADFIQAGQRQNAIQVLLPILRADAQNVEAWWLLANAVDQPRDQREALEHVLALQSDHQQARQMLDRLSTGVVQADDPFADHPFGVQDDSALGTQPHGDPYDPFGGEISQEDAEALFSPLAEGWASAARDAESPRPVGRPMGAGSRSRGGTNPLVIMLAIVGAVTICACVACLALAGSGLVAGLTLFGDVADDLGILVPSDVVNRGSLAYGAVQNDTLQAGALHAWTFTGSTGDPVVITVSGDGLDPIVSLYGPSNILRDMDDGRGQGTDARLEYTLTNAGTYTIVVRSANERGSGAYSLRLSLNR